MITHLVFYKANLTFTCSFSTIQVLQFWKFIQQMPALLYFIVTIRPKKTCPFPISNRPCPITCYSKVLLEVLEILEKIPPLKTYVF